MLSERVKDWTRDWREQGLKEGREQGLAQGLEQGRKEEATAIVTAVIERRFGEIPEWVGDRLKAADAAQLHDWALALLDAPSLETVFR